MHLVASSEMLPMVAAAMTYHNAFRLISICLSFIK